MSDPTGMADRHSAMLAQLAERAMALACALQERALAAETPAEMRDLALAFHRISRTVRQSVALEAKLVRDQARAAREDRADAAQLAVARTERRVDQIRAAVRRDIREVHYGFDADNLEAEFDERLEAEALDDGFLDEPIEAQIARLCADLGLTPEDLEEDETDETDQTDEPDEADAPAPPPANGHDRGPSGRNAAPAPDSS